MHKAKSDKSHGTILPRVGWREWVSLPELSIDSMKAKIDTGAHNSSLHAQDLEYFTRRVQEPHGMREREFVRFTTDPNHPGARGKRKAGQPPAPDAAVVTAEALVLDRRAVRSSSGESEVRPVIATRIRIGEYEFPIELNLTDREMMGFRMLIGRQSIHGRFWVDPSASYLIGR